MKTAYMALLIGVLMLSPSEAREEFMSKRASALMSALNVEAASDEIFSPRHGNDLTALKHTKTGNLTAVSYTHLDVYKRQADIVLRNVPAILDLDADVPEASEESVGFLLADKSAHPDASRHLLSITGPENTWGYASNIVLSYDTVRLLSLIHISPSSCHPPPGA